MLPTLLVAPTWAAEFQVTPTFGLSQYYTDNVNLAPKGQERSDWVTAARIYRTRPTRVGGGLRYEPYP